MVTGQLWWNHGALGEKWSGDVGNQGKTWRTHHENVGKSHVFLSKVVLNSTFLYWMGGKTGLFICPNFGNKPLTLIGNHFMNQHWPSLKIMAIIGRDWPSLTIKAERANRSSASIYHHWSWSNYPCGWTVIMERQQGKQTINSCMQEPEWRLFWMMWSLLRNSRILGISFGSLTVLSQEPASTFIDLNDWFATTIHYEEAMISQHWSAHCYPQNKISYKIGSPSSFL